MNQENVIGSVNKLHTETNKILENPSLIVEQLLKGWEVRENIHLLNLLYMVVEQFTLSTLKEEIIITKIRGKNIKIFVKFTNVRKEVKHRGDH